MPKDALWIDPQPYSCNDQINTAIRKHGRTSAQSVILLVLSAFFRTAQLEMEKCCYLFLKASVMEVCC